MAKKEKKATSLVTSALWTGVEQLHTKLSNSKIYNLQIKQNKSSSHELDFFILKTSIQLVIFKRMIY